MSRKYTTALIVLIVSFIQPIVSACPAKGASLITAQYYYYSACGSCDEAGKFRAQFDTVIGDAGEDVTVAVKTYNTFQAQNNDRFNNACDEYGIPREKRVPPLLIMNGSYLLGQDEIDSGLYETFRQASADHRADHDSAGRVSTLLYFYVSPCDECAQIKDILTGLSAGYTVTIAGETFESPLNISYYNVSESENLDTIHVLFERYNVPDADQKVPIMFLADTYLSGKDAISQNLIEAIRSGKALGTAIPETAGAQGPLTPYEWPGLFLTGIVNGLNPCSVSMLLFLIALLLSRKSGLLKMGLSFMIGKFVAYTALGTVLFSLLLTIDAGIIDLFQDIVKYILVIVVAAAAALNISDFIAARHEKYDKIRLQLPRRLRRLNHDLIRRLSQIGNTRLLILFVFVLGLLISVGEFLCTGQVYLITILYILRRSSALDIQTMGAFLVYVSGMMIPSLALMFGVWKGKEIYHLSEFVRRHMPLIKIANALIFLLFGVILILM